MTDPTREQITKQAADAARERHTLIYLAVGGAALMAVVLFVLFLDQRSQTSALAGQVGALASAANQNAAGERTLASQVQQLGGTPAVRVPTAAVGPSGPQGPGPSQQQINDAVNAYFGAHPLPPGQLPTATQVATAVAAYLEANPPVTPAQVVAAVVSYCSTANGCRGPSGADGQPGQNATDAQVAAAVSAYCSQASNPCQGPAGPTGATGPSGAQGVPGPACPDGYTQHDALIEEPTSGPNPLITSTQVPGVACVADTATSTSSAQHAHK